MMKRILILLAFGGSLPFAAAAQQSLQKLHPVGFSSVNITDAFWKERMSTVSGATLDACILYTENKTGRIRNFEKAAQGKGTHEGIYYDDSDVYKAIEAMAYSLKNNPDEQTQRKAEEWITKIAAAQLPDGYLNTFYQLTDINKRWTDMEKHEDYCAGHLIEAAIAWYNTTGKRTLLDVAIRFADHIDATFRLKNRPWVSGHQEIELALMKLYHLTQNRNYLDLAKWFLDQRGHGHGKGKIWDEWKDPEYCQDLVPVKDQRNITGHAVRAMYMYTGAADVAAVTNDAGYSAAMNAIWEDVVHRNMYITGGIGAQGTNEGFGKDYDLPNMTAYCETCASVGMVFWNQRMNMLTGQSKYIDVLERSLYNGALDGLSLSGDRFFYGNPLASTGQHNRKEWYGTACCPSNIARLVSSLGDYVYSTANGHVWVNLFIGNNAEFKVNGETVALKMETGFPWKGNTEIILEKAPRKAFALHIRKPGWLSQPAPGDLYTYKNSSSPEMKLLVNGKALPYKEENGYLVIHRAWKKGDRVEVETPMEVKLITSKPELKQNNGKVALQYGPFVYCVEGADNGGHGWNFIVPRQPSFTVQYDPALLGGTNVITFDAKRPVAASDGLSVNMENIRIKAIPYFSWNNRGAGDMQVWLPEKITDIRLE